MSEVSLLIMYLHFLIHLADKIKFNIKFCENIVARLLNVNTNQIITKCMSESRMDANINKVDSRGVKTQGAVINYQLPSKDSSEKLKSYKTF